MSADGRSSARDSCFDRRPSPSGFGPRFKAGNSGYRLLHGAHLAGKVYDFGLKNRAFPGRYAPPPPQNSPKNLIPPARVRSTFYSSSVAHSTNLLPIHPILVEAFRSQVRPASLITEIIAGHKGLTADARIARIGSSIVPPRLKFLVASLAALRIASSASLDWARSTALILPRRNKWHRIVHLAH